MKKNTIFRIAAVVLMCALVTACFASSTFARYANEAKGSDSVTVAKWAFEVNGKDIATNDQSSETTVDFKLFDTILDTKDGATEKDVTAEKIAPGTKGSFAFELKNTSEVTVAYNVALKVTNAKNVPVKFYTDAAMENEITDFTKALSNDALAIGAADENKTIYWQWVYGENVDDNVYGIETPSITVEATVTATQVD
ncbi:MAG: hypothetical protein MJ143_00500 [Clostridia bacterium]|nr:hypothetical protein [Clostridia bacterium]